MPSLEPKTEHTKAFSMIRWALVSDLFFVFHFIFICLVNKCMFWLRLQSVSMWDFEKRFGTLHLVLRCVCVSSLSIPERGFGE